MTVSIVTPWLDAAELIPMYESSTRGAQIVIVDNGSTPAHAEQLAALCYRTGGVYIRNDENALFAKANNQGLKAATGEIIVFMNNDVQCRSGFVDQVQASVQNGSLYGPSRMFKHDLPYLEGWCIAARREVWEALGGWEENYYSGLYWEDNDLSFRAMAAGYTLIQTYWPVWHYNNYTTSKTPGAFEHSAENERKFVERVRSWRN